MVRSEVVRRLLGDDPLLTTDEVAALFRVSPTTVTRWADAGRLAFIRTPGGGELRFRESVIRTALKGVVTDGHQDVNDHH